jgi:hypothetical protein
MKFTRNVLTIADLNNWFENRTLIVNREYQRVKGLWPNNARSYFIDTILNDYPFPKITIMQIVDLKTKASIREIIDGQQRMMTINDFLNNKIVLSSVSDTFKGMKFSDIDEELQQKFLSYEASVDTVIGAQKEEVLEIFRRINSYTLPLNEAEKRHATYQGEFKWFIKDLLELYSPLFENYNILTIRQLSRMGDADLMTELCQILMAGIITRSNKKLDDLYKHNDRSFYDRISIEIKLKDSLDYIKVNLYPVLLTKMIKPYSFYSLFSALIFNKWGILNISEDELGSPIIDEYTYNIEAATANIMELLKNLEQENISGSFGEFVRACLSTTHSVTNRKVRLKWFVQALQNSTPF